MAADLFSVVKTGRMMTDRVLVSYSGGKDSVATLDLCSRYFPKVAAFFMYMVPDLAFQERTLKWAEARYGIEILRLPHFGISQMLRRGSYAVPDWNLSEVSVAETYAYVREQVGIHWIAAGQRIADSIPRRQMIIHDGTINAKRGVLFPLAHWRKAHVTAYIKQQDLRVSEEARILGHSFRSLRPLELWTLKQHYPGDYERIRAFYPMTEASVKWQEFYGAKAEEQPEQVPGVHG